MHKRFKEAQAKAELFLPILYADNKIRRKNGEDMRKHLGIRLAYVTLIKSEDISDFKKHYVKSSNWKGKMYGSFRYHASLILKFLKN